MQMQNNIQVILLMSEIKSNRALEITLSLSGNLVAILAYKYQGFC